MGSELQYGISKAGGARWHSCFLLMTCDVHLEFFHLASGLVNTTHVLKERGRVSMARLRGPKSDRHSSSEAAMYSLNT